MKLLSKADMGEKTVVILSKSTDADSVTRLRESAENLGFHLENSIAEIGALFGTIDDAQIATLSKLKGVSSVREEDRVQIAPPAAEGPY